MNRIHWEAATARSFEVKRVKVTIKINDTSKKEGLTLGLGLKRANCDVGINPLQKGRDSADTQTTH